MQVIANENCSLKYSLSSTYNMQPIKHVLWLYVSNTFMVFIQYVVWLSDGDRMRDFQIGCSDSNDIAFPTCYQHEGDLPEGQTMSFDLRLNHTRFVVVRVNRKTKMNFCELEVYGNSGNYIMIILDKLNVLFSKYILKNFIICLWFC